MFFSALLRRPFVRQGIRVCAIMAAGDIIAQNLVEKKCLEDVDLKRTIKFASVGLFLVGPTLHFWFGFLDKAVSKNQSAYKRGFKKMAADQLMFAPVFTAVIVTALGKVNRESHEIIVERLKYDYPTIMLRNYMLWPLVQVINFTFMPVKHQVLFAQLIAVAWNIYMSLVLNKKVDTEPVFVEEKKL